MEAATSTSGKSAQVADPACGRNATGHNLFFLGAARALRRSSAAQRAVHTDAFSRAEKEPPTECADVPPGGGDYQALSIDTSPVVPSLPLKPAPTRFLCRVGLLQHGIR